MAILVAGEAYIMENAKDYENLTMKKLKDNKLSYTDRYYNDKAHGRNLQIYPKIIVKKCLIM